MKTKNSDHASIACISDIHLGHRRTPTRLIVDNLYRAFPDSAETRALDVICIVGDLFDRLLTAPDPDLGIILVWMTSFLRQCQRNDTAVILLEGTPSHDWRQNQLMVITNDNAQIGAELHYVDTLSVVSVRGLTFLCVPDEWRPDTNDTWKDVCQALQSEGLSQVDVSLVHGAFSFQLPDFVKAPTHDPERYQSITRYVVDAGHVHKPAGYGRVLSNGSFDRLAHGEEEAKGHWRIQLYQDGLFEAQFRENLGAMSYVTVDCRGLALEEALAKLAFLKERTEPSFVRISAEAGDAILANLPELKNTYPQVEFSSTVEDRTKTQAKLLVDMRSEFHQLAITPENVRELLIRRLEARETPSELIEVCDTLLQELLA